MYIDSPIGDLITDRTVAGFRRQVTDAGSFFFSPAAMKHWRTSDLRLYRGVVMLGTDNRPEVEFMGRHWVRVFTADFGFGHLIARGNDHERMRRRAQQVAKEIHDTTWNGDTLQ